jgi:hypothetical protein
MRSRACFFAGAFTLALTNALVAAPQRASAQVFVDVAVTIERIRTLDCIDPIPFGCDDPDLYAVITIDGTELDFKDQQIEDDDISPNWQFVRSIDLTRGSVPVVIQVFDADGFLRGDDDHIDLDPTNNGDDRNLELSVMLAPCEVRGDDSGGCGVTLISAGTQNDRAEIRYRVEVTAPATVGFNIQCMHRPIWPMPGETITITANALDGNLDPRIVDQIEIFVDDTVVPAANVSGGFTLDHDVSFADISTFTYGCQIMDPGTPIPVSTGWRVVQVGQPPLDDFIPVLFTGPRDNRVDLVFFGDRDDYTASGIPPIVGDNPDFIEDVGDVILNAYYNFEYFLANQHLFNFWIALDSADYEELCMFTGGVADFADSGIVLHLDALRDCATGGRFSIEPFIGSRLTVLHETGHRPFGMADEYCCDGGYFEASPFPNLYQELNPPPGIGCGPDAPNLGRTAADCRMYNDVGPPTHAGEDWFLSDPTGDDLMEDSGAHTPQAADVRRLDWFLNLCRGGNC